MFDSLPYSNDAAMVVLRQNSFAYWPSLADVDSASAKSLLRHINASSSRDGRNYPPAPFRL